MVTDDGPKVLEFNARFGDPETEVILPRLTTDLAEVLRASVRGGLERLSPLAVKPEACVGVVLCSAGYPGNYERGRPISGLADAARMPGVELFHAGTARDDSQLVTAGGRVLVVTATGASLAEAAARAYEAADRIHFDGKHLRRDIAAARRPSRA
jgi:phosphoribosylamine--glycine ligase